MLGMTAQLRRRAAAVAGATGSGLDRATVVELGSVGRTKSTLQIENS